MKQRLIILGTGNAFATKCYNTCFAIEKQGEYFLVDGGGGNGILTRLNEAAIDRRNIHNIFVTHKHVDHILGIIWMIRVICQDMHKGKFYGQVNLYANDEVIKLLRQMCQELLLPKQTKFFDNRFHFIEVEDGQAVEIMDNKVTFFDIQSTKDKQMGFTMELEMGERLTCCGDEPYNPCEEQYVKGSKWLMHEAFCLQSQADKYEPYEKHHSTVADGCKLAQQLGVANLILYHTEDDNIAQRKKLYTEEGKAYYSGNLYVPDDLETFEL